MKNLQYKKLGNSLNWESDKALKKFEENKMAEKDKKKMLQMEDRISEIANEIQLQLNAGKDILKIYISDFKDINELVDYILSKDSRKNSDVLVLMEYLTVFSSFVDLLSDNEGLTEIRGLLYKVSLFLKKEKIAKDEIIFLNGQLGKTFYLILDGEVSVLVPLEQSVYITNIQFFKYLEFLLENKEYELIRKTFESNEKIFSENGYQNREHEKFANLNETFLPANMKFGKEDHLSYMKKFDTFIDNLVNHPIDDENEENEKSEEEEKKLGEILQDSDNDSINENNKKSENENSESNKNENEDDDEEENTSKTNKKKSKKNHNINKFDYMKRKYFIWKYNIVCTLGKGKSFGELALQKESSRRTATIITNKDCKFGTLQKDEYQLLVKETLERARKINIEALMHSKFFYNYRIDLFESHYFNCFKYIKKVKGEYLFIQNTKRENIYFIKKGDVQIELLSTWNNLDNVLNILGFKSRKNINWQNMISENEKLKIFVDATKRFNISIFSSGEVIGMEEHSTENGEKFLFSALCLSSCEIFSLELKFLEKMLNERTLKNNYTKMAQEKKNKLVQRIIDLKANTFYQYNNMTEKKNNNNNHNNPGHSYDNFVNNRLKQNTLKVKKKLLFLSHEINSFRELNPENKEHSNIHINSNSLLDSKLNSEREKRKNCISTSKTGNDFFQINSYNKKTQNSVLNSRIDNNKNNLCFNNISINKAINAKDFNRTSIKRISICNDLTVLYNSTKSFNKNSNSVKYNKTVKDDKDYPDIFIENESSKTNSNLQNVRIKCSIANRIPKKLLQNAMTYNTVIDKLISKKNDFCDNEKDSGLNTKKSRNSENNSTVVKNLQKKTLSKFDILSFDNFMNLIADKYKKNNTDNKNGNNENIRKTNYNRTKLLPISYTSRQNFYKEKKKLLLK